MTKYFHFTIGPVQSFVSQARRTKDFWAGSFLLSYLSGVAMIATKIQEGKILFPLPDDEYLAWIEGCPNSDKPPRQGNIPNRFKAEVKNGFEPQKVVEAVQKAWLGLCELVWQKDFEGVGAETRAIWDRQVGSFWELNWVISGDKNESNLLDRRKNWRTHKTQPEPGQKCSIMSGLQELSGVDAPQSKEQKDFWKKLKEGKKDFDLDVKDGEQLCAIAYVKRRFTRHFDALQVDIGGGAKAHGLELNSNVPSVALLAAAPWLSQAIEKASADKINNLIKASKKVSDKGTPLIELKCVKDAKNAKNNILGDIFQIDGMTLYENFLENKNNFPNVGAVLEMKTTLSEIRKELEEKIPSAYYAVLMMDGDKLGEQMSHSDKQGHISKALNSFTKNVMPIVREYSGFLIYAGGDDVAAILPVDEALGCAAKLRESYDMSFGKEAKEAGVVTSISAAVIFAHVKIPLHSILASSHLLLDDIAKEKTGRDALAVQIVNPGGVNNTWAKPWKSALEDGKVVLERIAKQYKSQTQSGKYSNSFFYRIKEIVEVANSFVNEDDMAELLAAEYRTGTDLTQKEAKEIIEPLLTQCIETTTDGGNLNKSINADGALIVKFLAQKGVW